MRCFFLDKILWEEGPPKEHSRTEGEIHAMFRGKISSPPNASNGFRPSPVRSVRSLLVAMPGAPFGSRPDPGIVRSLATSPR